MVLCRSIEIVRSEGKMRGFIRSIILPSPSPAAKGILAYASCSSASLDPGQFILGSGTLQSRYFDALFSKISSSMQDVRRVFTRVQVEWKM
jgi:hypothetical protein